MNNFIDLLNNGKTQFHVVSECCEYLHARNFKELNMCDEWGTLSAGSYYVKPFSSMLVAFVIGDKPENVRIASAHTDFPMLKLKSNPEITVKDYMQVNVEPYGGLILHTWFDRPLGLAGKVITKGANVFEPKVNLFDSQKPLFIIPNLAPHLKKDSKTQDIDVQREMIPLMSCHSTRGNTTNSTQKDYVIDYISEQLNIKKEDILDFDLYLYIYDKASYVGLNDEFLTSARIDNISSVSAIMSALFDSKNNNTISIGAFFDNEEIGSRSKQGADSLLIKEIIERIVPDKTLLNKMFNISVDVSHATHPNYIDRSDITNDIILGNGVVLKSSAAQKYVTDSEAGAVIVALCQENNIRLQRQVNRSGMPGGQTLGPILSAYLPIRSVDIGMPMLAMHSARECVHRADYNELVKLLTAYYEY